MLLLVDADDTLWENNVYFERAIEKFIDFVNHEHYSREEVRTILDDIERANTALHGYGSAVFARNLQQAYQHLARHPIAPAQLAEVSALAEDIARQELEIIEGVPETLEYLSERHRVVLLTKGCEEEQTAKLNRSGLRHLFHDARVVREKDAASYRGISGELAADAAETWMIGNSPRSDINPAIEAGLNAVWVPHSRTWVLEQEELRNGGPGKLLTVERFSDLRKLF